MEVFTVSIYYWCLTVNHLMFIRERSKTITKFMSKIFFGYISLFFQNFVGVCICKKVKVKWSHYRPGVAQRVGRGIALLFHDRSTRRGWVVSSTPWPHFNPGKDLVPILQEAGSAPGLVWKGGKSRPHRDSILDHEGGNVVSPMHRPPLCPRKYSWYSFLLEAESNPGP